MSSQKGNASRNRPQKFKNSKSFSNTMHDTSQQHAKIRQLEMVGLCARCKDILDWKVKYKKYKPLTQPRACVKCGLRAVKRAYYTVCDSCAEVEKICAKCGKPSEIVCLRSDTKKEEADKAFFEKNLRSMRERERRTILRLIQSAGESTEALDSQKIKTNDTKSSDESLDSRESYTDASIDDDNDTDLERNSDGDHVKRVREEK